jgi:hypothetical protein
MNCPNCKRETEPSLFCRFCDVYAGVHNENSRRTAGVVGVVVPKRGLPMREIVRLSCLLFVGLTVAAVTLDAKPLAYIALRGDLFDPGGVAVADISRYILTHQDLPRQGQVLGIERG